MASSAALTDEVLVKGGGAGAAPEASTLTETEAKTHLIGFMVGADNGSALVDADDQATFYANRLGFGITLTEVWCECDGGTPRIQLEHDDGTPNSILTDNGGAGMDCSTSGATGTIDAAEDNIANGSKIDFTMVTAGGTAKRITLYLKYTID